MTGFLANGLWQYFPQVPYTNPNFLPTYAKRHYIVGSLLLLIAVIDHFTFYNYPMQRKIILGKSERSYSENHKLIEIVAGNADR